MNVHIKESIYIKKLKILYIKYSYIILLIKNEFI